MTRRMSDLIALYCDHYDNLSNSWNGSRTAILLSRADNYLYMRYKNGETMGISQYQCEEIETLSILDSLGYPMYDVGTYLYKGMIMSIYEKLKSEEVNEEILNDINDPYSSFYQQLAREDYDMGVKMFHSYINNLENSICDDDVSEDVKNAILGENNSKLNVANKAFMIASYMALKNHKNIEDKSIKM